MSDNEISGHITGNAVQAANIETVHVAPQSTQNAHQINNFVGPVDARGAHFGPRYDTTPEK